MNLDSSDKVENAIDYILVVPDSARLFGYYINGTPDKHTLFREEMIKLCTDLCPDGSAQIRKYVLELLPFAIYPQSNKLIKIKNADLPKINKRAFLFPRETLFLNKTKEYRRGLKQKSL